MTDGLGRIVTVDTKNDRFVCRNGKEIEYIPYMCSAGEKPRQHVARGKGCTGTVYGPHNWRICAKCGAEVRHER